MERERERDGDGERERRKEEGEWYVWWYVVGNGRECWTVHIGITNLTPLLLPSSPPPLPSSFLIPPSSFLLPPSSFFLRGEELSSDALPINGYEHCKAVDYGMYAYSTLT